ncbi:MAG: ABC transporter permease [Chloroflexota bacterium]
MEDVFQTELGIPIPEGDIEEGPRSWSQRYTRLYLLLHNRSAIVGMSILAILLIAALAGPWMAPFDPYNQSLQIQLTGPSSAHHLGTDQYGRDIFSRILYGTRSALLAGVVANGIATVLGVFIGLIAGYYGRWIDALLMRMTDVMLSFPYLLLALIIVSILGTGLTSAIIAIGIVYTPQFARLVRGTVLEARDLEYVQAARALGIPSARIMRRHVLPNVLAPIMVMATLTVGLAIVETAGLSFLGLGAQPPAADWGAMLADGRSYMLSAPWIATFPGLAILITVLGFNLLGDGLRDVLNPRLGR